jgi:hypothetical protein
MHAMRLASALALAGAALALGGPPSAAAPTRSHTNTKAQATVHHFRHGTVQQAASCGEYKYRHDGKCVDARDKGSSGWSESMAKKPAW